jgi:hypothetical protein
MITSLYNFAELLKEEERLNGYFSPAENPFEGRENKGKILVGVIEGNEFKGFQLQDFTRSLIDKVLYRSLSGPKGTGIIPTLYVNQTGKDKKGKIGKEKTGDKLRSSLRNNKNILNLINEEKVISDFLNYQFNPDFYYLVTFNIGGLWFGEIEAFKDKFYANAYSKYYDQPSKGKSYCEDSLCSITGRKDTVYGYVNTLGFSINDEAFIRGGFESEAGYKMFPVSKDAIPILEGAKSILENKLSDFLFQFWDEKENKNKKFSNIKYAIIPHFLFVSDPNLNKEIAEIFLTKAVYNIDARENGANGFINGTETILKSIVEEGELRRSDIYYDIIFFEKNKQQFLVHSEISDVLPSMISKVLKAKKLAQEKYKAYNTYQNKNGNIISHQITLYRLREYFGTGEKNLQPSYFKLVNSIFTGQPYDDSKLLSLVLKTWKKNFKKYFHHDVNIFNRTVKCTLGNLYFLHILGIFKNQNTMQEQRLIPEKQDAFSFIDAHDAYFTKEYLKGAFIFGCLVARLLYNQPGNAFMKELNGLNIDKELVVKKFPKLIAKLRQYGKEFIELESAAQRYFAINDKAGKDEISFAFTMGLVLQKDFDRMNKINNENKNIKDHE